MKTITILILFLFLFCSRIEQGEVFDKGYEPKSTVMLMIPSVTSDGKSTTTIITPLFFYYPERWFIKIKGNKDGKEENATWWVNKETFDRSKIGSWFCKDDKCEQKEPRINK